jgi:DNA mismatch repair protein MutS
MPPDPGTGAGASTEAGGADAGREAASRSDDSGSDDPSPSGSSTDGSTVADGSTTPEGRSTDPGPPREAVTGPPPSMLDRREELTPMLSQYLDRCCEHEDALVLFQVGDFYEAFCEAAEETARVCEVTLTKREDSTGEYPMAGIPIDNATTYVASLLEAGYRVALAEQVEDADEASGLVDRAVTRVVTPGTLTDDELLAVGSNYVACLTAGDAGSGSIGDAGSGSIGDAGSGSTGDAGSGSIGDDVPDAPDVDRRPHALAAVDVSTGECRVTSGDRARMLEELDRLGPAELLVEPGLDVAGGLGALTVDPLVTDHDPGAFERDAAADRLAAYVPDPDAVVERDAELRAVGALLAYAEYTQGDDGPLSYVSRVTRYDPREYVRLDAAACRSLELFDSRGDRAGTTLLDVVDRTATAPGRRRLESWLRRPLLDRAAIEARHGAVAALVDDSLVRAGLRETLRDVYDVERLISRVSRGRANARDLRSLLASLDRVPEVRELLADVVDVDDAGAGGSDDASDADGSDGSDVPADARLLADLHGRLDELADVRELLREAIAPDPPQELTEGGVIREGFDGELDALRATEREGREWVADLEASERERTGIDSLSVGHNQVHGYYIEVTNPNLDRVPDDYTRRQTLKNAERFYTPELKRREDEILGAAERADKLEYELFCEVRSDVAGEAERVQAVADALAELDALASLAAVAVDGDYCRPEVHDGRGIGIEAGRHPVVERAQAEFVPNDAELAPGELAVITGPNMSGKSTYMRQVALVCVLAQAGSFVPAESASLPVLDRVFTRVGASDDIAGGQSTFMREMTELTEILRTATPDSLVLLDEVGRGTSTADGRAIARAAAEFVHDEVRAHTLFATHYHDLTSLADERERVRNLHFTAERTGPSADGDAGGDHGDATDGATGTGVGRESAGGEADGEADEAGDPAAAPDATAGGNVGVEFLHRVLEGPASSSYGVEVARMAGVPAPVVERAHGLVADRDDDGGDQPTLSAYADDGDPAGVDGRSDDLDDLVDVAEALRDVELAGTTPLEALNLLAELKGRLDR